MSKTIRDPVVQLVSHLKNDVNEQKVWLGRGTLQRIHSGRTTSKNTAFRFVTEKESTCTAITPRIGPKKPSLSSQRPQKDSYHSNRIFVRRYRELLMPLWTPLGDRCNVVEKMTQLRTTNTRSF